MPRNKDGKPLKKDGTPHAPRSGRPKIPVVTEDLSNLGDKLPPRPIDFREVFYWMDLGATQAEIAGAHHVSVDTLSNRLKERFGKTFSELKELVCGMAKVNLRKNQFKLSETNAAMAIWLGKQWLGQKDMPPELESFNGKLSNLLKVLGKIDSSKGIDPESADKQPEQKTD